MATATPCTYADLLAGLHPADVAAVKESAAHAPPFTDQAASLIRRVFAGAGDRIAARQQQQHPAA